MQNLVLNKMNKMNKIEDLVNIITIEGDHKTKQYVDYGIDKQANSLGAYGISLFEKYVEISRFSKDIKDESYISDYIDKIQGILSTYNNTLDINDKVRRNISKLISSASTIAHEGRIGPGTTILINEKNFESYSLHNIKRIFNVIFVDELNDIIITRKNGLDQPGIILVKNDENYMFTTLGFYPDKQFIKINLN